MKMNARVPPPLTWHICHIIVDSLGLVVSVCILNQSRGHWLLNDALNSAISMSLKFRDEIYSTTFDNLMEKMEMLLRSCLFGLQHKKGSYSGFGFFNFFLKKL
jgi:hypothetical protein